MKDQLRGCIKINAEGRYLYRFINMLHSGRIACSGQYCRKGVFYGEIRSHDLKKVQEMADVCGVSLSHFEYDTINAKLKRYHRRIGLLIGTAIVILSMMYFSSVVVTIDIQGNTLVSDEVILSALEETGIKKGTLFKNINYQLCENQLMLKVDGIAWAGMHRTGNRIVVEVTEPVPVPERASGRLPCNIVSAHDAEITGVVVNDGMLMHKIGDFVPAGTMLISGVIQDDTGHVTIHHAMGRIKGRYDETVTFEEDFTVTQKISTGKNQTKRSLELFSLDIPLLSGKTDFPEYTSEEETDYLKIFGKEIPLGIKKKVFTEKEVRKTVRTAEQLDSIIAEKIFLYEKNFIPDDTEIISRDAKRTVTEDSVRYTVVYTLEGEIGLQKEIFIK